MYVVIHFNGDARPLDEDYFTRRLVVHTAENLAEAKRIKRKILDKSPLASVYIKPVKRLNPKKLLPKGGVKA